MYNFLYLYCMCRLKKVKCLLDKPFFSRNIKENTFTFFSCFYPAKCVWWRLKKKKIAKKSENPARPFFFSRNVKTMLFLFFSCFYPVKWVWWRLINNQSPPASAVVSFLFICNNVWEHVEKHYKYFKEKSNFLYRNPSLKKWI